MSPKAVISDSHVVAPLAPCRSHYAIPGNKQASEAGNIAYNQEIPVRHTSPRKLMMETKPFRNAAIELTGHRRSLHALTGIRFLAAAYVVVYHTKFGPALVDRGQLAAGNFFMSGYLAVALFFLLSGFILAYTYAGQISGPGDYRRFWEARFARIWPVYAVSLLLTSAVHLAFPKPSYMVATLFMLQAWNPFDHAMWGAWNYVCWTLSVEALFYLCFPWYQQGLERLTSGVQLTIIAGLLALAVFINSGVYILGYPSHGILSQIPLPLMRLPEFLTGVGMGNYYLARVSRERPRLKRTWLNTPGLWTYPAVLVTIALLCRARGPATSLVLIAFAALVFGLASERTLISRILATKVMIFGGGISYSIYLLQAPVKDAVLKIFDSLHIDSAMSRTASMVVCLLVLSAISFKAVEGPARQKIRSLFARLEQRRMIVRQSRIAA
jgi:peptidoglycan/LPS O-acetylase OafA/YrhL